MLGRHSVGIDIDPVAVFVSRVKTRRVDVVKLARAWTRLQAKLTQIARAESEYIWRQHQDISAATRDSTVRKEQLWVPDIPNIGHWFRKYVIVDLARILRAIESLEAPKSHIDFFRLCFAASIRNASNADPVPVSGLEVTIHMIRKDQAGRIVNPFAIFARNVQKNITALGEFCAACSPKMSSRFFQADATELASRVGFEADAVITSPPYHSAVDYYRRHTLEMYWLRSTVNHDERLELLPQYIGRSRVRASHRFVLNGKQLTTQVTAWDRKLRKTCKIRANAFKHYAVAMQETFKQISKVLQQDAPAVFVVGHSRWGNETISTSRLFTEMASPWFELTERLWYPIKNRYMSYARHNGASINREQVLVFRRKKKKSK